MTKQERINSISPIINGKRVPKKIRIYDNGGKTCDCYTAVFTGNYKGREGRCHYIGFNEIPHSPNMGIWQHGESRDVIDRPVYSHLGKPVKFSDLPEDCKRLLMDEYWDIWDLPKELLKEL